MMARHVYPVYDICHLTADGQGDNLLNADRFRGYLSVNPQLHGVHGHSFYHLVYFTEGSGEQLIDFETFPVRKGMIYFMRPGQVHRWNFKNAADGYIVNFSPDFFDRLQLSSAIFDLFPFFDGVPVHQVSILPEVVRKEVVGLFEAILNENGKNKPLSELMAAALLVQLLVTVCRYFPEPVIWQEGSHPHAAMMSRFKKLLEQAFRRLRLPRDYAALLHITPAHLNRICRDISGIPAGSVIRNRIILEAKRLLVSRQLTVSEISSALSFPDSSYFIKFFKKHTGHTPEQFRKQHYPVT